MPNEAPATGTEEAAQQKADEVLQRATNEAAAARDTIYSIEGRIHEAAHEIVVEPDAYDAVPEIIVGGESSELDDAAADFEAKIEAIAQKEQAKRMGTFEGNQSLRIDNAPRGVGGYHSNEGTFMANNVVQNAGEAENKRIYNHEWKGHAAVGLPSGNLDAQIASNEELKEAVADELHRQAYTVQEETAVDVEEIVDANKDGSLEQIQQEVAERVVVTIESSEQTLRDAEETWAVSQEGTAPSSSHPYTEQHLKPMDRIRQDAAGVEGSYDSAFNSLIHEKDNTEMVRLIARSKLREAGLSPSVN